jgi:hypothetical protein
MLFSAFYYTYDLLNMFRAPLCPSSGGHDYIPMFTTWNVCFLGLDGGKVWVGWLRGWAGGYLSSRQPIKPQEADVPCGEQGYIIVSS